jgi:hypothetical protein
MFRVETQESNSKGAPADVKVATGCTFWAIGATHIAQFNTMSEAIEALNSAAQVVEILHGGKTILVPKTEIDIETKQTITHFG